MDRQDSGSHASGGHASGSHRSGSHRSGSHGSSHLQLALLGANLVVVAVALVAGWQFAASVKQSEREVADAMGRLEAAVHQVDASVKPLERDVTDAIGRLDVAVHRAEGAAGALASLGDELAQWKAWKETVGGSVKSLDERVAQIATETKVLGETMRPRATAEGLRKAVADAEARWLPAMRPATLPADSDALRADIAELELALPQGESAAYASSIRMLGWWADALDLLAVTPTEDWTAQGVLEASEALVSTAPVRVPDWAYELLDGVRGREFLRAASARVRRDAATVDDLDSLGASLASVRRSLSESDLRQLDSLLEELKGRRAQAEQAGLVSEFAALKDAWSRFVARTDLGAELQSEALGVTAAQLSQLVIEMADKRLPLAEEANEVSATWRADLRKRAKRMQDMQRLAYQRWALQRIDTARTLFTAAFVGSNDYPAIRDAMIAQLVPVNRSELEPPLQQKFSEVWDEMKGQLSEELMRTVIEAVSTTTQKQPGDV